MDIKAIVDAVFADVEAVMASHPVVITVMKLINALIDQFLTANPAGGSALKLIAKK